MKSWVTSTIFAYGIWVTFLRFAAVKKAKPPFSGGLLAYFSK